MTDSVAISLHKAEYFELPECPSHNAIFHPLKVVSFAVLEGLTRFYAVAAMEQKFLGTSMGPLKLVYALAGVFKTAVDTSGVHESDLCKERVAVSLELEKEVQQKLDIHHIALVGCDALQRRCYYTYNYSEAPDAVSIKGPIAERMQKFTDDIYPVKG